ncbi:hypothetical protein [Maridesulfovibrio sp.]|uniref:hypothetical protein n=1 Tax=Maridesulfovibrio sp. TaxID=2795000 RepID=UPI0029F57134|nr:hypothetical protein [Maridesulfovibrio sp.]
MTIVSSGSTITFAGDGVQTLFDFNFRVFKPEELSAAVRDSEGNERSLVAGTDFKIVSGLGAESGGKVQYPVSGEPLPQGDKIILYRDVPYTQELELVENDPFSVQLLNETFDRGVMRDQQLQEQLDRALKYEISTPADERQTPQEFMSDINTASDRAVSAQGAAELAQNISEVARDETKRTAVQAIADIDLHGEAEVMRIDTLGDAEKLALEVEANAQTTTIENSAINGKALLEGVNAGNFSIPQNLVKRTLTAPDAALAAPGKYYTSGPLKLAEGANLTIGDGVTVEERGSNLAAEIGFDFKTTGAPATNVQDMLVYLYNEIKSLKEA